MLSYQKVLEYILKSSKNSPTIHSTHEILEWITKKNETTNVEIEECDIKSQDFWYLDSNGHLVNRNQSFFSIKGLVSFEDGTLVNNQPIIVQDEIGFLGIICKIIDGNLYFLLQAKIEPGNINNIQISPTIQATKSNFTRLHGGSEPKYLDLFINRHNSTVVVDQIQSEQSSRFYKKRNRNIIIFTDQDVPVHSNFMWMSPFQINELLKIDNLVNMDTRTVLSNIPYCDLDFENSRIKNYFKKNLTYNSFVSDNYILEVKEVYSRLNDIKMFSNVKSSLVGLNQLPDWEIGGNGVSASYQSDFEVIYCDIYIEGREVKKWFQPLIKAKGIGLFGLVTTVVNGTLMIIVKFTLEYGCFDKVELGPTIKQESSYNHKEMNIIEKIFNEYSKYGESNLIDVLLSEEGGRFYHEQNRNVILRIPFEKLPILSKEYMFVSLRTLNILMKTNNVLNIQLRNLISLIEV